MARPLIDSGDPETAGNQLRLLSIFHFVLGGLAAVFACVPVIHLVMGLGFLSGMFGDAPQQGEQIAGWVLVAVASLLIVTFLVLAGLLIATGSSLAKRKRYQFCFVVACIECLMVPLGTILGIFTILVLVQPTVKQLFGVAETGPQT